MKDDTKKQKTKKPKPTKHKKYSNKKSFRMPKPATHAKVNHKWTILVVIISFLLSVAFSAITSTIMRDLGITVAFIVLFAIIGINVFFDIVGTAVQTAEEAPLHSLARRRVKGAAESISIIRQAPQISNLCCDVIGDIAGIISGAATAIIVEQLVAAYGFPAMLPSLLLTGLVSSLTIGGKAVCKAIAMQNSNTIVFYLGKISAFVKQR